MWEAISNAHYPSIMNLTWMEQISLALSGTTAVRYSREHVIRFFTGAAGAVAVVYHAASQR